MIKRIAPLLLGLGLIGLGVLLIQLAPSSSGTAFFSRYWPVFLTLAGIVRLTGTLIDRHPRSPMGGIMIAAAGGILLSFNLSGNLSGNLPGNFPGNLPGRLSILEGLGRYWFWILLAFVIARVMKQYLHDGPLRPRAFSVGAVIVMILITTSGLGANFLLKNGRSINFHFAGLSPLDALPSGSDTTPTNRWPERN